jgi:hypothetical protein
MMRDAWPRDDDASRGASILLQLKRYYITLLAKMSQAAMKSKEEPKAKRPKLGDEEVKEEDDDDDEEKETPSTNTTTTTLERNDDGDAYIELSPKRRCTVRQWKGKVLVDIREVRKTWLAWNKLAKKTKRDHKWACALSSFHSSL